MTIVDALNGFAERGFNWAAASLVEAGLLLALAGLVLCLARRRVSPAAAHVLLLVVLVKAILPFGIAAPRIELPNWSERVAVRNATPPGPVTPLPAAASLNEPGSAADAVVSAQTPSPSMIPLSAMQPSTFTPTLTWKAWAMLTWAFVALGLAIRRVHAQGRLRRAIRSGIPFGDSLVALVRELALRLGIRRPIAVISGPNTIAPAVAGMWRSTLIVPRDLPQQLHAEQLRWVLLHELAHVRRGDLATLWLLAAAECLVFFNPAVWVAARWAEYFRECACDELAWRHADCERSVCGEAFLSVLGQAIRPSHALGFRSTHRQMRGRLLRLLEPAPRDRRRAASVAIACVAICAVFSVTQDASRAEDELRVESSSGGSKEDAASKVDKVADKPAADDLIARTEVDIERIWDEQLRVASPRSVKVRYRQLRLSKSNPDKLQQGHNIIDLSWKDAMKLLESIDLVNDPQALRKVRDRFLTKGLILDQPAANEILFQREGEKLRIDLDGGEYLVLVGNIAIHHRPSERLVKIGRGFYVEENRRVLADSDLRWYFIRLPLNTLQFWSDRKPVRTLTLADGSGRVVFGRVSVQRTSSESIPNQLSLLWHVDDDGLLERVESAGDQEWSRELKFKEYPGGGFLPKVRIDASPIGSNDPMLKVVRELTISIIEEAEFNMPLPPETFKAAVPANTAVWDRRGELKLRAAETPVSDVLTLFER